MLIIYSMLLIYCAIDLKNPSFLVLRVVRRLTPNAGYAVIKTSKQINTLE